MALDFPASPVTNQAFTGPNGVVWSWDGTKWISASSTSTVYAPINNPALTGNPTAPNPPLNDADTSIATTAYVQGQASSTTPVMDGAAAIGVATTWARGDHRHPTDSTLAPIASPTFTGDPKAPTPAVGDADTSIATTAFVGAAVTAGAATNVGRNLIHNSMFTITQRGVGGWTANSYTADRWLFSVGGGSTATVAVAGASDTTRTQIGDESARNQLVMNPFTGTAAAGSTINVAQWIEDARRLGGKTVTVSFWALSVAAGLKLGVSLDQFFGSGGSPSASVNGVGQSVTLASTWARYSLTFTVPSIIGKTFGTNNNDSTGLTFWYSADATLNTRSGGVGVQSGQINLWGVQLEIGTVATPLEKLDPVTQLQQCQRFYQTGSVFARGYNTAGATILSNYTFAVQMRNQPTVAIQFVSGNNVTGTPNAPGVTSNAMSVATAVLANGDAYVTNTFTASADL
jgi:hypothetical protein